MSSSPSREQLTALEHARIRRDSSVSDDYSVTLTNDDAAESKRYAILIGYWPDPFLELFWHSRPDRREPEINRGYWARVAVVKTLVQQFLQLAGADGQIVNLGAGFDTLFWQLANSSLNFRRFVEVDFSSVTAKKIHHILKHPTLSSDVAPNTNLSDSGHHSDLHGERYHLIGADLRQERELAEKLATCQLDYSKPTLFLTECVLVYMAHENSLQLLRFLAKEFKTACFVNYEQVNMEDKFGSVMKDNLHNRGIALAGMKPCASLEAQKTRFAEAGWQDIRCWTMDVVYQKYLPRHEIERIEKLEFLDEQELLWQLLQHYCICVASQDQAELDLQNIGFHK